MQKENSALRAHNDLLVTQNTHLQAEVDRLKSTLVQLKTKLDSVQLALLGRDAFISLGSSSSVVKHAWTADGMRHR